MLPYSIYLLTSHNFILFNVKATIWSVLVKVKNARKKQTCQRLSEEVVAIVSLY